jgi:hypothetical protein
MTMSEPCPAHVSVDGRHLLVADGPELLTYDVGGNPTIKHFGEGILSGLASSPGTFILLDNVGGVQWLASDGRITGRSSGAPSLGVEAAAGRIAAWGPTGLAWLVHDTAPTPVINDSVSAAALSPDGVRLGVGLQAGFFWSMDPATGGCWGQCPLPDSPVAIAWSASGHWVVAAANRLCVVAADGTSIEREVGLPGNATGFSLSPEGIVAAVQIGENRVVFVELHTDQLAGEVIFRRPVKSIAFAPDARLLIGLEDGDATLLDLYTGASIRTEPHPGRGRNNWNYENKIDVPPLRGALAHAVAGGAPIAQWIGPPPEKSNWLLNCLMMVVLWIVLCMGCSGCGGLLYYLLGL